MRIVEPSKIDSSYSESPVLETPAAEEIEVKGEKCEPNWICEGESECEIDYNLKYLAKEGAFLVGEKTKRCMDLNKCFYDKIEKVKCEIKKQITAERVLNCTDYIEIHDENNVLVQRLEFTSEPSERLDIQLLIGEKEYYPYCHDGIKNCNEDEVDCVYKADGVCPACIGELKEVSIKPGYPTMEYVLAIGIVSCFIWIVWFCFFGRKE